MKTPTSKEIAEAKKTLRDYIRRTGRTCQHVDPRLLSAAHTAMILLYRASEPVKTKVVTGKVVIKLPPTVWLNEAQKQSALRDSMQPSRYLLKPS